MRLIPGHAAAGGVGVGEEEDYPINKLRNAAIRTVSTTHFVTLDVDLWPSSTLLEALLAVPARLLLRPDVALVIPAFQFEGGPLDADPRVGGSERFSIVLATLAQMSACVDARRCATFYTRSSPETHSSTPYAEWWARPKGADPIRIECFKNRRYAPYVILPKYPSTVRVLSFTQVIWLSHGRIPSEKHRSLSPA